MILSHVRLLVANFAACYRFYRDVFQLHPHWGDENGGYASFHQHQPDQVTLALFDRTAMSATIGTDALPLDATCQDRSMLIFEVENVDAEVERMRAMGVKIEFGPQTFPDWGYRGAYVRDPDGNLIELSCGIPPEQYSDDLRAANEKYQT